MNYQQRRANLLSALPENSLALVWSGHVQHRNADTEHLFRPDSNFWYLTGFEEPDALLVLTNRQGVPVATLFCQVKDPALETWTGRRLGVEAAPATLGMDQAFAFAEVADRLPALMAGCQHVWLPFSIDAHRFQAARNAWQAAAQLVRRAGPPPPLAFCDLERPMAGLRLVKSSDELDAMRRAACITAEAHVEAMRAVVPGGHEYQLYGRLLSVFMAHGSPREAYPAIVAAGANACVLHYTANNAPIHDGDLVLIDAGCEIQGYAADITRTFPANGRFEGAARALYEVVLRAQEAAIDLVRPGNRYTDPHDIAVEILCQGLCDLGILGMPLEQAMQTGAWKKYYMHHTGHWLGMDVHDVGHYRDEEGSPVLFRPGMVLTIEPGLYINPDDTQAPAAFRGIGIRIEDDVVVTDGDPEVLTAGVPKDMAAIEALMAET
jgi:Xaa-Pro aminopeptidase